MASSKDNHFKVAIIGSGFGGLGSAIRLGQIGESDYVVFEKANDVGGVWRDNSYPGCAVDVECNLYSFSFAPYSEWSRTYSPQGEIWKYLRKCAEDYKVRPKIKFGHEVLHMEWSESKQHWKIKTSKGDYSAQYIVAAMGALSEPSYPNVKGLDQFKGVSFHSARWNHDYDLKGKRVAVIGTGASAIQFVPHVQKLAEKLYVFQRTPAWIVPHPDRPVEEWEHKLYRSFPFAQKLSRLRIFLVRELLGSAFRRPQLMRFLEHIAIRHMKRAVKDPALQKALMPNYTIGCKRILPSNKFYPAIASSNVELVTEKIDRVTATSVVTASGKECPVDAIIYGTGFKVTEMPFANKVVGKKGVVLSKHWDGSPRAFMGTTVSGFPNIFILQGPSTGLGHSSVVLMMEAQIEHFVKALQATDKGGWQSLEPKAEAQKAFDDYIDQHMSQTVWVTGGCSSWYLDKTGRNSTLWPGSIPSFKKMVTHFNENDYRFAKAVGRKKAASKREEASLS